MGAFPQPSNPFLEGMKNSAYLALAIKQSHLEQQAMAMRQQEMQRRQQVDDFNMRMGLLEKGAKPTQSSAAGPEVQGQIQTPGISGGPVGQTSNDLNQGQAGSYGGLVPGMQVGGGPQAAPIPVNPGQTLTPPGSQQAYYMPSQQERYQDEQPIRDAAAADEAKAEGLKAGARAKAEADVMVNVPGMGPVPKSALTLMSEQVRNQGETDRQVKDLANSAADRETKERVARIMKGVGGGGGASTGGVRAGGGAGSGAAGGPSAAAQLIASYRLPPPSPRVLTSPAGQAVMAEVMKVNPDYDGTQFPLRSSTRKGFTTGSQGQQLATMNTAMGHLDQFVNVAESMGNGSFKKGNQLWNWARSEFGDSAPTNFDGLKTIMAGELASVFKKSGATDEEIKNVSSAISSSNSPQQLRDYVTRVAIPAMGSKLNALDYAYHAAMGAKDPFSALSPESKQVLQKYGYDPAHPTIGGGQQTSGAATQQFKVGQQVKLKNGQTVTVKVVHPNGTFDTE